MDARGSVGAARTPSGNGWKRELMSLIAREGRVTARARGGRTKPVSNATMEKREKELFRAMRELQALGYKIKSLSALKRKHVEALVQHWVKAELSTSTLQNRISLLRTLAGWLGKPDLVGPSESLVSDPALVRRTTTATYDHSWSAFGIDAERLLVTVSQHDRYVGMQLRLCHAFFLRVQEAVMFKPRSADHGTHIVVRDGTKGGRERVVMIETDYQRRVLDEAKEMVRGVRGHVGHPDLTLKQALRRVWTVCERFGITKRQLGVTTHGLRHEGLNDLFESIAGVPSPVRRIGDVSATYAEADKERLDLARARVAEAAGHARLSISGAYIGRLLAAKQELSAEQRRTLADWTRYFELAGLPSPSAQDAAELSTLRARLLAAIDPGLETPHAQVG